MNPLQRLFNETFASSSNGKRADSESVNEGSSPSEASIKKREWLNDEEGTAYVVIDGKWRQKSDEHDSFCWIDVELKDCTRQINLDFGYDTEEEYRQKLRKIAKLRSALQEVENFMVYNPFKGAENKS